MQQSDADSCARRRAWAHLDEQCRLCEIQGWPTVLYRECNALELLQVLLKLRGDVNVPVRCQVADRLQQVRKAVLFELSIRRILDPGGRHIARPSSAL